MQQLRCDKERLGLLLTKVDGGVLCVNTHSIGVSHSQRQRDFVDISYNMFYQQGLIQQVEYYVLDGE
jgi:hypothetical protein